MGSQGDAVGGGWHLHCLVEVVVVMHLPVRLGVTCSRLGDDTAFASGGGGGGVLRREGWVLTERAWW